MRDYITLFINGQSVRVRGEDAFLPLSDYLRRRRGLTGTKVVCAEGDCGSCAVLVGRVDGSAIRYSPITSCIAMVFQMDGAHVITVEGLGTSDAPSPIQESMVKCQGTQCGFCTPGFVVALHGLMHGNGSCSAESVKRGLVGNLCRCTGYDSIVQAALETDRSRLRSLDEQYPPADIVRELTEAARAEVKIAGDSRHVYKPATLAQALKYRAENPGAMVIAGATDAGVVHNKRVRPIESAVAIGGISELRPIDVFRDHIAVGACASLSDLERVTSEQIPEFGKYLAWFGSPLIKNGGTLAGNVVTGSPIGDSIPVLMAMGAQLELASVSGKRIVPIGEFYTGYRKSVLKQDELVTRILLPRLHDDESLKLYKVSRRKDLDISTFNAAIWWKRGEDLIEDIRIAFGGVGPMVLRIKSAEDYLRGKTPTRELFEQAATLAEQQVTPITDVRGSESYRRLLSRNALLRFWHDCLGKGSNGSAPEPSPSGKWEPALSRDADKIE